ncbi:hypothetical protein [Neptunomonas qingdaonensis]|uniref:Major Facilitator Superfamily protein n=1 Tax=Neptunomonas qingdaonensis TaxID=1045558 RepID=A0A1I2UTX1_9GAMM|nr:hypothetical protein [Neptunomonas qingdaonensis]SFG80582.1 hypothetical protein SAMN05216175_11450 [Neptunomonas qingdaonensis]
MSWRALDANDFGVNQIISHGFGVFLFAALVPLMKESIDISHWHLATIGALTQLSYLGGTMLLGLVGHRIASEWLVLITGSVTSVLLFVMAALDDPMVVLLVLRCMAACAAISWGAIVELITRYARPSLCSTCLSSASSGTAWGYGLNGWLCHNAVLYLVEHLSGRINVTSRIGWLYMDDSRCDRHDRWFFDG